jgi:hypothetical protein
MAWSRAITYAALSSLLFRPANAERVWPDPKVDELEKLLYEQENPFDGPGGLASFVDGCSGPAERALGIGRSFGAEWIRNAYHDMSTADVVAGTGGLDASIVFEMDRPENIGDAFQETLNIFKGNYNKRVSMSDLFALATVMAVGGCSDGKVIVPLKGGRVDAAGPGPSGVPEPQQDLPTHSASFAKQGFDTSEMIALVACGHTVGGVHGVDFPEIVPNPTPTDGVRIPISMADNSPMHSCHPVH